MLNIYYLIHTYYTNNNINGKHKALGNFIGYKFIIKYGLKILYCQYLIIFNLYGTYQLNYIQYLLMVTLSV